VGALCSFEANGTRVRVRGGRDGEIRSSGRPSAMAAAAAVIGSVAAGEKARGGAGWMRRACAGRWRLL
jgi:hypothetical protein